MGTCPVGFDDTTLGAASGGRCVKGSVAHESENGVFVARVDTLELEDFGCADAVGVAGLGLRGFHLFDRATIARHSPPVARWGSAGNQTDSTKCFLPDPWAGIKTARWPPRAPAQARQSEQGVPTRSEAHRVSME